MLQLTRVDDMDGSAAEEVRFGWDGEAYVIDLGSANKDELERALEPFLKFAKKYAPLPDVPEDLPETPAPTKRKSAADVKAVRAINGKRAKGNQRSTPPATNADMRTWGAENGYQVAPKGRVSREVEEAFRVAHQG